MPGQTVFSNIEEGLDIIQQQRAVIHTFTGMLKGYFKANPFRIQNLKVFAKGRATFYTLIVPFNSPLKPILQLATTKLQEAGTMDYLITKWEGKEIASAGQVETMILSPGQVVLVFFIVAATFSISGCIFLAELCHKKVKILAVLQAKDKKQQALNKARRKKILIPKDLLKYPDDTFLQHNTMYHTKNSQQTTYLIHHTS